MEVGAIGAIGAIRSATELSALAANGSETADELGRNQFLKLMITQLNNQDPLNPSQNEDFLAQLAQFSSLEGIENLNRSVSQMAAALRSSLTMESASLVGRSVLVPTGQALVRGDGLFGSIELAEASSGVTVEIVSLAGEFVRRVDLGAQAAGVVRFRWDGTDESGDAMPEGVYKIRAMTEIGGQTIEHTVNVPETVVSVSFAERGTTVNLAGGSSVPVEQIIEIQ